MQTLTTSYEHSGGAAATFVHPNGNVYLAAVVKASGVRQHLAVYRLRPDGAVELVKLYQGGGVAGAVSPAQVTMGGLVIRQDGAMVVAFSAPTFAAPAKWVPQFDVVPGVDSPWVYGEGDPTVPPATGTYDPRVPGLEQRVAVLESSLAGATKAPEGRPGTRRVPRRAAAARDGRVPGGPPGDDAGARPADAGGPPEVERQIRDYFQDLGLADSLPLDCEVVQLAELFGKLPDEVAEGMSEYWHRLSVVYFSERARSTRKADSKALPSVSADELDDKGRYFLTG
jgi:hypothetical protein